MVITADCGIGSAAEVAAAKGAGIEAIVTDHHEPPPRRTCPTARSSIPSSRATPSARSVPRGSPTSSRSPSGRPPAREVHRDWPRASATPPRASSTWSRWATVADLVPLIGENRGWCARAWPRCGPRRARACGRLWPCRRWGRETVDAQALGFRLAPRINAAGRLYRADAGVELMLTEDPEAGGVHRGRPRPGELTSAGRPSGRSRRSRGGVPRNPRSRRGSCMVLAGEGWHPGVVGIAASAAGRAPLAADRPPLDQGEVARGSAEHPRVRPDRGARRLFPSTSRATVATAPPRGSSSRRRTSTRSVVTSWSTPQARSAPSSSCGPRASMPWSG